MKGERVFYVVVRRDKGNEKLRQVGLSQSSEVLAEKWARKAAELNIGIRFYVVRVQEYFEVQTIAKSTILLYPQEDTDGKTS